MGKLIYRLLGIAFAIPTSMLMKKALDTAWRNTQGDEPPRDPKSPDTRLSDIVAWAGLSALSLAVGQFVASRGAAVAYRGLTGRPAPGWEAKEES
jgi:hypothetical protein